MLNQIDPDEFLSCCWQKVHRFMPGAASQALPSLAPDELAWLATQPDVESRLVFTERTDDAARYRLESGPFTDAQLSSLPDRDWTLLVQDVEKHLPDFRQYLGLVSFIPDWRIDDLMISCAAPGGSVGPHLDNYDVFLVQGTGTRRWQIGKPDEAVEDPSSEGLSLVRPFEASAAFDAKSGDVLYLPPGVPHWGVAEDLCMTMSIGCRAPTQRELELGQERVLGKPVVSASGDEDSRFYSDGNLSRVEAEAGKIDPATIERLKHQNLLSGLSDIELGQVFGSVVTDPKAWLLPDGVDMEALRTQIRKDGQISVHGMASVAWMALPQHYVVFVNGEAREIDLDALSVIRDLCTSRSLTTQGWDALDASDGGAALLAWMGSEGLFDAGLSLE